MCWPHSEPAWYIREGQLSAYMSKTAHPPTPSHLRTKNQGKRLPLKPGVNLVDGDYHLAYGITGQQGEILWYQLGSGMPGFSCDTSWDQECPAYGWWALIHDSTGKFPGNRLSCKRFQVLAWKSWGELPWEGVYLGWSATHWWAIVVAQIFMENRDRSSRQWGLQGCRAAGQQAPGEPQRFLQCWLRSSLGVKAAQMVPVRRNSLVTRHLRGLCPWVWELQAVGSGAIGHNQRTMVP